MYYTSFIHKTKLKTLLLSLIVSSSCLLAQNEPIIIDTTFLKCEYATNYYTDTLKFKDAIWMGDKFILEVGSKVSKFYSKSTDAYERVRSDPEANAAYQKSLKMPPEAGRGNRPARHSTLVIYSNYPKSKRTIHDAIFFDYYIFEDDNLPQQWTVIADSVKTILGYTCHKATCSYCGRNYEAWYAIDLPVNAGPWKFSGLPGLIMSVQDTKGHYTFEIK
ncbi:MAG TPA: GLPGLI family protein, partial [Bacteroidales bacterium]|nr:GLPGLI family protein [Bacteroidales bacterium]